MKLRGSLLFHLNLSYSSIEVEERAELVARCYWPILRLLDGRPWLRLCIEATGHTLERIAALDPAWLARLRAELDAGRVEFIGSGDTQLIGPLVPAAVNRWNQQLGVQDYERLLGSRPRTALVGEMAWSQGLVDHYVGTGYETLLMEWNNPRRTHPEWEDEWRYGVVTTASPTGRELQLLFADAIAFQKFQRAAVGDVDAHRYCEWVLAQASNRPRHLFLYASDAEVFDYRPGRYTSEPPLEGEPVEREWQRIGSVLDQLHERGLELTTPSELRGLSEFAPAAKVELTSFANPIPVKKQPKYNVTRWALSGRDDVGLNRMCFARARELAEQAEAGSPSPEDWRELCRAWQSDHRTHLTLERWKGLESFGSDPPPPRTTGAPLERAHVERDGRRVTIETDGIELELDAFRGLAITKLAAAGGRTLVRTLPHGYFDDIHWAADFYSGHLVAEVPAALRVTDLSRTEPELLRHPDHVELRAVVETDLGPLEKRLRVFADRVSLHFGLASWSERPVGSVRVGFTTLDPEVFGGEGTRLRCANGGVEESFVASGECDQWSAVSALISSGGALGATEGRLVAEAEAGAVEFRWDPAAAAALPLVLRREVDGRALFRIGFSLSEIDDTHRVGAPLYDFELELRPRNGQAR